PILGGGSAFASEFDVLNDGPPKETYVVDGAGVLSRVTRSDLKKLLADLEYRKKIRIDFVTVRKLTVSAHQSKADAFEYADQVLERWYPTLEEGNNKGIVVLVTSQKEGAVTGGPEFIKAVGDTVLDGVVSQNLPGSCIGGTKLLLKYRATHLGPRQGRCPGPHQGGTNPLEPVPRGHCPLNPQPWLGSAIKVAMLAVDEKYNEAIYSSAKRLAAAIDGLPDPGGPQSKDSKRESNFKTKEETAEKRDQFTVVV
ncbi:hypothetical protein M8C21_010339, partial [Ambrosia artemisiifolia]